MRPAQAPSLVLKTKDLVLLGPFCKLDHQKTGKRKRKLCRDHIRMEWV